MRFSAAWQKAMIGIILLGSLLVVQGCSYARYRINDAKQMGDFGLTFSKKFQFSAYMNCPVIAPLGYGNVDGYFVGVGNNQTGVTQFHQKSKGALIWGSEEVNWSSFDPKDADSLHVQGVGVLGLAERKTSDQPYKVACLHYFHLGWVGIVANVHWLEIPDFGLGFVGLDPMGDDGEQGGWWFGRRPKTESALEAAPDGIAATSNSALPGEAKP